MAQLFQWWRERRKARLESDTALQETIDNRIKIILESDEKTILRLQFQMTRLEAYIAVLVTALQRAGIPVPDRPDMEG